MFNRKLLRDFEACKASPEAFQRARLSDILTRNRGAGYLRHYGVEGDLSPSDLRRALPVVTYDALWPWIEPLVETGADGPRGGVTTEPVSMFLKTSGTTGRPKLLPVTPGLEAETDRARRIWIERMIADDERNAVGCHMAVISPMHEDLTPGGLPMGSNTGRIFMRQPELIRAFAPVPYPLFGLRDFDLRYFLMLRLAAGRHDVGTLTTANPSTILMLCRRLAEDIDAIADDIEAGVLCSGARAEALQAATFAPTLDRAAAMAEMKKWLRPDKKRAAFVRAAAVGGPEGLLHRLWPQLTTVNCWLGGHAPLYLGRLAPFLSTPEGSIPMRDPGFSASEGFFAIPLRAGTPEGVLHCMGPFMEFIPEGEGDDRTLLAHELEVGARYRIVVTTSGGLWRYDMQDVVEVTGRLGATPTVRFLYKSGGTLSVTGEKITEGHAVAAAASVADQHDVEAMCATFEFADPPRYVLAFEPGAAAPSPEALAASWDAAMRGVNVEYAEKRDSGRLGPPLARPTARGAFGAWRQAKVNQGAPDGQVKLPPLVRSFEDLTAALLTPEPPR